MSLLACLAAWVADGLAASVDRTSLLHRGLTDSWLAGWLAELSVRMQPASASNLSLPIAATEAACSTRSADRPWNHRLVECEKLWTYQWGGHIYYLLLKRGEYYVKFAHEESWKPVDMPGSDRWLYRNGRWINLASATHYFYLGLWKEFAFRLLPHMDDLISSQTLSSREIKH